MPCFGDKTLATDFEWSLKDDPEAMLSNNPIKVCGFKWKKVAWKGYHYICALQLLFSNGTKSPLFAAKGVN